MITRIRILAKPILILILLSTSLSGSPAHVQNQPANQKRGGFEQFVRTELYFGRNISSGGEVSKRDFNRFLAEFITPRFPDGLTVVDARGQFLNSSGDVERERTVILILLYPVSIRQEKHIKVEEIREEYKAKFQQQSVLRVDDAAPVWVSF